MTIVPPPPEVTVGRQGNYAGGISRLLAFAIDIGSIWVIYTIGAGALSLASQLVTGTAFTLSHHQLAGAIVLVVWGFVYFAYQWTLSGKTIGMALLGLRVVTADGGSIRPGQAVRRTVALPFSFILFGIGLIGILVQRERRAFHDMVARTAVVYSWDARAARLRWLAHADHRRGEGGSKPGPRTDPAPEEAARAK